MNGAGFGDVEFINTSNADRAILIADGGLGGGAGATIFFFDDSKGGSANVTVSGNGNLDLSFHNPPGVTIGSLQGDGLVFLGTGAVQVKSGALGGAGTIAGAVTVGTGTPGNGAFLTPGESFTRPGVLTILSSLTFNSDGFLNVGLAKNLVVGEVVANGVTINSGASFAFFNNRGVSVPVGTVLTLINNTAATPIAGVFDNLPDGLVFTDHSNTFEVSYEGGDGNDLTLTSVP